MTTVDTERAGTEVALRPTDVPAALDQQMHLAKVLAVSDLLPGHLRGTPANVLVVLQGARALDVPAFWALQSMHVIDGKLGLTAELMRALVVRAGHAVRVVERTDTHAVVEIQRRDRADAYRAEFTMAEAAAAGLSGKANWKRYPKAMLVARATSIAVRDECPDVLFGVVYTPDELGVVTDAEGDPVIDGEVLAPPAEASAPDTTDAMPTVDGDADEPDS